MGKHYDAEFKMMIVDLLSSGQTVKQVSKDYNLNDSMLRRWKREALSDKASFTGKGVLSLTPEEKEIRALKLELKETKMERDILKKALGIFSKKDN